VLKSRRLLSSGIVDNYTSVSPRDEIEDLEIAVATLSSLKYCSIAAI
jgi:hypothetical protein